MRNEYLFVNWSYSRTASPMVLRFVMIIVLYYCIKSNLARY